MPDPTQGSPPMSSIYDPQNLRDLKPEFDRISHRFCNKPVSAAALEKFARDSADYRSGSREGVPGEATYRSPEHFLTSYLYNPNHSRPTHHTSFSDGQISGRAAKFAKWLENNQNEPFCNDNGDGSGGGRGSIKSVQPKVEKKPEAPSPKPSRPDPVKDLPRPIIRDDWKRQFTPGSSGPQAAAQPPGREDKRKTPPIVVTPGPSTPQTPSSPGGYPQYTWRVQEAPPAARPVPAPPATAPGGSTAKARTGLDPNKVAAVTATGAAITGGTLAVKMGFWGRALMVVRALPAILVGAVPATRAAALAVLVEKGPEHS